MRVLCPTGPAQSPCEPYGIVRQEYLLHHRQQHRLRQLHPRFHPRMADDRLPCERHYHWRPGSTGNLFHSWLREEKDGKISWAHLTISSSPRGAGYVAAKRIARPSIQMTAVFAFRKRRGHSAQTVTRDVLAVLAARFVPFGSVPHD